MDDLIKYSTLFYTSLRTLNSLYNFEIFSLLKAIGVIFVFSRRVTKKLNFIKTYILSTHFVYISQFSLLNQLELFLYIISYIKLGEKILLLNSLISAYHKDIIILFLDLMLKYIFSIRIFIGILKDSIIFVSTLCLLLFISFCIKLYSPKSRKPFETNIYRKFNHLFMFYMIIEYGEYELLKYTIDLLSLIFAFLDCFIPYIFLKLVSFLIRKETEDVGSYYYIQLYLKCFSVPLYLLKYEDVIKVSITICIYDTFASVSGMLFGGNEKSGLYTDQKTWIGTISGLVCSLISHYLLFNSFKRIELYFIIAFLEKYTFFIEDNFLLSLVSTGYLYFMDMFLK